MEEFLNKLYSYENFGIYLIISIVVLVILFVVILIFGKKDKKEREIEATKKLQQINADAFKDDSIAESVEINNDLVQNNNTIVQDVNNVVDQAPVVEPAVEVQENITPVIEEAPSIMNTVEETVESEIPEPVLPVMEHPQIEVESAPAMNIDIPSPVSEPTPEINIEPVTEIKEEIATPVAEEVNPILEKIEEKPLVFNDIVVEETPVVPIIEQVEIKPVEPVVSEEVEVPTFNFDEIVKSVEETKKTETNYTKGPQIFSSVYVPEKEDLKQTEEPVIEVTKVKEVSSSNDDLALELPTLKKDVKVEEPKQPEVKEEKIEVPVLNDYDLDNLSGETYEIK